MSDERQQHLRRQAAGGDAEAHAKLLAERVRCGELDPEALQTAARLGHAAARAAAGLDPLDPGARQLRELDPWLRCLKSSERGLLVRTGILASRAALPFWVSVHPQDEHMLAGLESAEARFRGEPFDRQAEAERTRTLARMAEDEVLAEALQDALDEFDVDESEEATRARQAAVRSSRAAARSVWRVRRLVELWERGASRFTLEARAREVLVDAAIAFVETPLLLERLTLDLCEVILA